MSSKPKSRSLELRQTKSFGRVFIESQFYTKTRPVALTPSTSLSGKTALITGGTAGLGLHAARHLLSLQLSRLILPVRSPEKGERIAAQLRNDFPSATIEVWELEMSSYKSVQALAKRCNDEFLTQSPSAKRLDIAILNAGVAHIEFTAAPETGHCNTIQVNYWSTALLALLLLPVLRYRPSSSSSSSSSSEGGPGRLTIVGSGISHRAKVPNRNSRPFLTSFDDPLTNPLDLSERYASSKLLSHFFFIRLLDHLPPTMADEVIVNIVDPGLCKGTDLHREAGGMLSRAISAGKTIMARPLDDGAWTYVDAAVVKGKESHGCFVMDWEIRP